MCKNIKISILTGLYNLDKNCRCLKKYFSYQQDSASLMRYAQHHMNQNMILCFYAHTMLYNMRFILNSFKSVASTKRFLEPFFIFKTLQNFKVCLRVKWYTNVFPALITPLPINRFPSKIAPNFQIILLKNIPSAFSIYQQTF